MGEDGNLFDANAFEKKQKAERLKALRENLLTPVGTMELKPGQGETPITPLDAISSKWRQEATMFLHVLDPEAYQRYRALKYGENGENPNPNFEQRKKAYRFAVARFLDASYKIAGF